MATSGENALPQGYNLVSDDRSYKIEKVLGSGGFGITYLTVSSVKVGNVTGEMPFAVKEHFPSAFCRRNPDGSVTPLEGQAEQYKRSADDFEAEARRLQKFGTACENIVKVNEVFKANGTVYYVMQYIKGESLAAYVGSKKGLPAEAAKTIMAPIFDAVEYLHSCRVNHLDIKPDNIMLEGKGGSITPILIDFGLSVHFKKSGGKTSPKGLMGVTDGFAPMEQYAGIQDFNPATDVYALAATFLYCLTGKVPAKASELRLSEVRKALEKKLPEDEIEALCRALARSFDDRTQSVASLKAALGMTPKGGTDTVVISSGDSWFDKYKDKWYWLALAIVVGVGLALFPWSHDKTAAEDDEPIVNTDSIAAAAEQARIDSIANARVDSIRQAEAAAAAAAQPSSESGQQAAQTAQTAQTATQGGTGYTQPQPIAQPTTGTLNLGYATWSGGILNGKQHGSGRLTFNSAHAVDRHSSVQASPGDYFVATYDKGLLVSGKLYDSSGNLLNTIIP